MYRQKRGFNLNPLLVLIIVNVVIYFTQSFIDPMNSIEQHFALTPSLISQQPWTLVTYMFLHGSWVHLIMNMLSLYFLGTFAIQLVGETAFLTTYFAGGIVGGIFYWLFSFILPTSWVVGASGSIYAMGGLLMVMRPNVKVMTFPIPIPMPLWIAILGGFIFVSFFPRVAWQAHLGGILYGAAVGYYYRKREYRNRYR